MELENIVEKITREVMESMKIGKAYSTSTDHPISSSNEGKSSSSVRNAVLLAGSSNVNPEVIERAISFLRTRNLQVTAAINPVATKASFDGATTIRCSTYADCAAAVRNANVVVILLADMATISRLANLIADQFEIEAVMVSLEAGKEVWGLKDLCGIPSKLTGKINNFLKEIENFGVKISDLPGTTATKALPGEKTEKFAAFCPIASGEECAGCNLCASLNTDQVKKLVEQGAERISSSHGISKVPSDLAGMIDHTLLKPDATRDQVLKLCDEAKEYKFASVCINPTWVPTVAESLKGTPVKTCVVIGFPLGANSTVIKSMETRDAIASGADEVDMVINVGALKAGDYDLVRKDIEAVVQAAQGRLVKVILETALLTDEEKVKACQLAKQAGADFVKTSTGFGPGGATAKDIALMRQTVGKYMGVKASGGIRDFATAQEMIKAGATRIGASASVAIVKGAAAAPAGGY